MDYGKVLGHVCHATSALCQVPVPIWRLNGYLARLMPDCHVSMGSLIRVRMIRKWPFHVFKVENGIGIFPFVHVSILHSTFNPVGQQIWYAAWLTSEGVRGSYYATLNVFWVIGAKNPSNDRIRFNTVCVRVKILFGPKFFEHKNVSEPSLHHQLGVKNNVIRVSRGEVSLSNVTPLTKGTKLQFQTYFIM